MKSSLLLPLIGVITVTTAQFIPAPTDLLTTTGHLSIPVRYKTVPPGICETTPGVQSLSGYVDVAADQHIFFWFFESRTTDPSTAPLTVWINGGPGSSSMIGLFQENGPCGVDAEGLVYNNPYAWNNASNLLFIDQPVGTGFSYSSAVPAYTSDYDDTVQLPVSSVDNNATASCPSYAPPGSCGSYSVPQLLDTANSTLAAAPAFWRTLQGFLGAFPAYARNGFHLTTESYGGHYGPIFASYIESQNALIRRSNTSDAVEIALESLLVGNGWYDPLLQYAAYYNFTVSPGNTYDYSPFTPAQAERMYNGMYGAGNCRDLTLQCAATGIDEVCTYADDFCYYEVEAVLDDQAGRDEYDIRELTPDAFPYEFYVDYLNTPTVQRAIGAFVNFSESSNYVGDAFGSTGDDDREDGTIEAVRALVEQQGVYVVQYAGDADYNCNWLGGQAVAEEIAAPGFAGAGFVDVQTSDGVVHGQVKQAGNFAFARVYYSGHEVPFYQPLLALEMFERVIGGRDVATGEVRVAGAGAGSNYSTVGPSASTFREGNATVQWDVLSLNSTYNTTSGAPAVDKRANLSRKTRVARKNKARKSVKGKKMRSKYRK